MIKNPNLESIPKELNKHDKIRKEMLEKCDGGIYLEIFVPNMSKEEFEKWELGESIENSGYTFCVGEAKHSTHVVFHNVLCSFKHEFEKDNPMVMLGELVSQMKNKMVIDEEDLNDDESKWEMED